MFPVHRRSRSQRSRHIRARRLSLAPRHRRRWIDRMPIRLDRASFNLAAPRPGFRATILDEFLESLQVTFHPLPHNPEHTPDFFDRAFRTVIDLQPDLRAVWSDRFEIDHA